MSRLIILTVLVAAAAAQQPLTITVSAVDKKGEPVANLTAADVRAKVNGKPAAVTSLAPQRDLSRDVVLLVDSSNSASAAFQQQLEAAYAVARPFLPRVGDNLEVIGFSDKVEPRGKATTEAELKERLQIKPAGGTALWEALFVAAGMLAEKPTGGLPRERIILLVSDGENNLRPHRQDEALHRLQEIGAVVYALYTEAIYETRGTQVLKMLTRETGGEAFLPVGEKELARSVQQLRHLVSSRHQVTLLPAVEARKGRFRLDLRAPKNVRLHYPKHVYEARP
jgi:Ca-activated chloride channel family protein